jgi:predicted nucleotidyltransferase
MKRIANILDYARDDLDQNIWNTKEDKITLQENIRNEILDIVYSAVDDLDLTYEAVKQLYIYGSILTNRYNSRSDLDVRIVLDKEIVNIMYPNATGDDLYELIKDKIHGVKLLDTDHLFNATLYIEGEEREFPLIKSKDFPVYDILNEKMLVEPVIYEEYDPDERFKEERDDVDELMEDLDGYLRELKNDSIDYLIIEEAVKDVSNPDKLIKKLEDKLSEIEEDIKILIGKKDEIKEMRTEALTEDPKKDLESMHFAPGNVKMKFLERYLYWDLLKKLKEIFEPEEKIDHADIDELIDVLNLSSMRK